MKAHWLGAALVACGLVSTIAPATAVAHAQSYPFPYVMNGELRGVDRVGIKQPRLNFRTRGMPQAQSPGSSVTSASTSISISPRRHTPSPCRPPSSSTTQARDTCGFAAAPTNPSCRTPIHIH